MKRQRSQSCLMLVPAGFGPISREPIDICEMAVGSALHSRRDRHCEAVRASSRRMNSISAATLLR
jgi:hypothetical protein